MKVQKSQSKKKKSRKQQKDYFERLLEDVIAKSLKKAVEDAFVDIMEPFKRGDWK